MYFEFSTNYRTENFRDIDFSKKTGRLAYFFSRLNNRGDPNKQGGWKSNQNSIKGEALIYGEGRKFRNRKALLD